MLGFLESLINSMGVWEKAVRVGNIFVVSSSSPSLPTKSGDREECQQRRKLPISVFFSSESHRKSIFIDFLSYSCYPLDHKETSLSLASANSAVISALSGCVRVYGNTEYSGE